MATINQQKLAENLTKSVVNVLKAQEQSVVEGMLNLKADMTDRIFLNGLDNSNSSIGNYSTKPMYASLNQPSQIRASSLKPRGKKRGSRDAARGSSLKGAKNKFTGANVQTDRLSMYLPGGYFEFRAVVGRQNSKVDLNLTGSLKSDIRVGVRDRDKDSGNVQLAFTTDKQVEIAKGNEARFNKTIFAASDSELETLTLKWETAVTEAFFNSFD